MSHAHMTHAFAALRRAARRLGTAAALIAAAAATAHAQPAPAAFPSKPIELRVPFVAGTAPDAVARTLADAMSHELGVSVLVVNQPGAGGAIGYKYLAAQKPDGYALILSSNSITTSYHAGLLPFDHRGLEPVARVSLEQPVFVVKADSPMNNLKDAVAFARANPGQLRVGNPGVGSHMHLMSVAFFQQQGVEVNHVPFATSGHIGSLLGSHIDAVVALPGTVSANVKGGGLKVLGVLAKNREPLFPQTPTAGEQGMPFDGSLWRGIAAPRGTPAPVLARLERAVRAAVASESFRERGRTLGFVPAFASGAELSREMAAEDAFIAGLMDRTGLKAK